MEDFFIWAVGQEKDHPDQPSQREGNGHDEKSSNHFQIPFTLIGAVARRA
jgi:hypothetical protein